MLRIVHLNKLSIALWIDSIPHTLYLIQEHQYVEENITSVDESVQDNLKLSVAAAASTTRKKATKDFWLHPNKTQLMQELKPHNHHLRIFFADWSLEQLQVVNKPNCRIRSDTKPEETVQTYYIQKNPSFGVMYTERTFKKIRHKLVSEKHYQTAINNISFKIWMTLMRTRCGCNWMALPTVRLVIRKAVMIKFFAPNTTVKLQF